MFYSSLMKKLGLLNRMGFLKNALYIQEEGKMEMTEVHAMNSRGNVCT